MKFFSTFAILAFSAVAVSASPVDSAALEKRAGPSGKVVTPNGGFRTNRGSGIELEYTRVNGDQGYFTEYIDVDLVDEGNGKVYRVATGLTSANKTKNIQAWFNVPEASNDAGKFRMRITEYQIGSDAALISFQSASPEFIVQFFGGGACAGAQEGNCSNTF